MLLLLLGESAGKSTVDGGDELCVVDRLLDEVLGAGPNAGDRHGNVGMSRYQNHRQRDAAPGDLAYELDSIDAGHAYVSDDAAEHAQHFAESLAHRLLVVDDEYRGPRQAFPHRFSAGNTNRNSVVPGSLA